MTLLSTQFSIAPVLEHPQYVQNHTKQQEKFEFCGPNTLCLTVF